MDFWSLIWACANFEAADPSPQQQSLPHLCDDDVDNDDDDDDVDVDDDDDDDGVDDDEGWAVAAALCSVLMLWLCLWLWHGAQVMSCGAEMRSGGLGRFQAVDLNQSSPLRSFI